MTSHYSVGLVLVLAVGGLPVCAARPCDDALVSRAAITNELTVVTAFSDGRYNTPEFLSATSVRLVDRVTDRVIERKAHKVAAGKLRSTFCFDGMYVPGQLLTVEIGPRANGVERELTLVARTAAATPGDVDGAAVSADQYVQWEERVSPGLEAPSWIALERLRGEYTEAGVLVVSVALRNPTAESRDGVEFTLHVRGEHEPASAAAGGAAKPPGAAAHGSADASPKPIPTDPNTTVISLRMAEGCGAIEATRMRVGFEEPRLVRVNYVPPAALDDEFSLEFSTLDTGTLGQGLHQFTLKIDAVSGEQPDCTRGEVRSDTRGLPRWRSAEVRFDAGIDPPSSVVPILQ